MKLRECGCPESKYSDARGLDVFCVMEGCWGVLCQDCGALSYHADTKEQAIEVWKESRLQRKQGYFTDGSFESDAKKIGRQIHKVVVNDKGCL